MDFARPYPKPIRLYRGSTYTVSSFKPPEKYEPVLYDGQGFPVRWEPTPPRAKQPIGFRMNRGQG